MEKGQIVELTIEDMSAEGRGIGKIYDDERGFAVFVQDTVVGDRAKVELTKVKKNYAFGALTLDAEGRVTSAVADMAEPALTVASDGGITAPDKVETKLEQGDRYGMRGASALNKEWYEHSEGFCGYLKGKTRAEVAAIPADGSDADLVALCTISVTDLQKAALDAMRTK